MITQILVRLFFHLFINRYALVRETETRGIGGGGRRENFQQLACNGELMRNPDIFAKKGVGLMGRPEIYKRKFIET